MVRPNIYIYIYKNINSFESFHWPLLFVQSEWRKSIFIILCFAQTHMKSGREMQKHPWNWWTVLVLLIHQKYRWSKKDHNLLRVPQDSCKDHFKADEGFSSSSGEHHDMIPWLLGCPGKNILILPQVRHGRAAEFQAKRGPSGEVNVGESKVVMNPIYVWINHPPVVLRKSCWLTKIEGWSPHCFLEKSYI